MPWIYGFRFTEAEAGNLASLSRLHRWRLPGWWIAPKLVTKLAGPLFMQAFVSKGRMQQLLESIPVKLITNDKIALFGAARYAVAKGAPTAGGGKA